MHRYAAINGASAPANAPYLHSSVVAPPSLASCDIRPPRKVEVSILHGAKIAPSIHGHKKTPTSQLGFSGSLLGDEPRAIASVDKITNPCKL
jgi:hypothetical protein